MCSAMMNMIRTVVMGIVVIQTVVKMIEIIVIGIVSCVLEKVCKNLKRQLR